MKNRLYYVLAVLYVLMFAFVLYINGAFQGEITLNSNLMINIGFLIVIGILFFISFISFERLNKVTSELERVTEEFQEKYEESKGNLWKEYCRKKDIFGNSILNTQFGKYQQRIASHTNSRGAVTEVCQLDEYINEVKQYNFDTQKWESVIKVSSFR